jgi:hypothetical protein
MMSQVCELPEHFEDSEVCTVLRNEDTRKLKKYPLTCGLVMKVRTALIRVIKRSILKSEERKRLGSEDQSLYKLIETFTSEEGFLHEHWPSSVVLHNVVLELSIKAINLSPTLQREFSLHPLGPPKYCSVLTGDDESPVRLNGITYTVASAAEHRVSIHYDNGFLRRVRQYHEETQRPDGTFDSPVKAIACSVELAATDEFADTDDSPQQVAEQAAEAALLLSLANMPKETCPQCLGRRQVYCGDCGGRRMAQGGQLLPPRVDLPFDVLLLVHWQETLHKCTGVHVGALCAQGTFASADWRKEMVPTVRGRGATVNSCNVTKTATNAPASGVTMDRPPPPLREQWKNLVETLDHTRDVLLFPCEDAVKAEEFPWKECTYRGCEPCQPNAVDRGDITAYVQTTCTNSSEDVANRAPVAERALQSVVTSTDDENNGEISSGEATRSGRWRLVVLEASWNYGKGMAMQLRQHRESVGLPPLQCVQLTDVTGQYWKFQTMGHAAVSTIEAIAYTARAAGITDKDVQNMLALFQLQKYRVLQRIEKGGKVPRAVQVSGAGLGCWKELTDCLDDIQK